MVHLPGRPDASLRIVGEFVLGDGAVDALFSAVNYDARTVAVDDHAANDVHGGGCGGVPRAAGPTRGGGLMRPVHASVEKRRQFLP